MPTMSEYMSRGEVTTDEGETDSDDDDTSPPDKMAASNHSGPDSGLSTAENATEGRSPMVEEEMEAKLVINGHATQNSTNAAQNSTKVKKVAGDEEFLDENELVGEFEEGLKE